MTLPRWLARWLEPRIREAEELTLRANEAIAEAAADKAAFYRFHEQELADRDRKLAEYKRRLCAQHRRAAYWKREARHNYRRLQIALDRLDNLAGTGARVQESEKERADREAWEAGRALVAAAVDDMIPRSMAGDYQRTLEWGEKELRRRGIAHAQAIADEVRQGIGERVTVGAAGAAGDDDE